MKEREREGGRREGGRTRGSGFSFLISLGCVVFTIKERK